MRITVNAGGSGPMGIGARILVSLFFSFFLLLGSAFVFFAARGAAKAAATYTWRRTACRIVESRVAQESDGSKTRPYVFQVLYRYELAGRSYESRTYKPAYSGSEQVSDAQRLTQRYLPGSNAVCYVDPGSPENACLERPSLWTALLVLFPLIFVAIGGGGIAAVWWPRKKEAAETGRRAISEQAKSPRAAAGYLAGFFSIFFLAGAGFSLFFFRPALRNLAARSWPEVPCVVLSSQVRRHAGDNGSTYSVDILYEYAVGGRTYRSNRYQFLGGSSSGYDSKAAVVARNPPGTRRACFVNPADPNDAVLTRDFGKDYIIVVVPILFMGVGLAGILFTLRGRRRARGQNIAFAPAGGLGAPAAGFAYADESLAAGPVVLKSPSPLAKLVGTIFLALFWNGIVSVFVWQMIKGWRHGEAPACLTLFLVPFVLVGLAFIAGIGYYFLALFNPRPRITLSSRAIPLGGTASLDWTFSGAVSRIQRLQIQIEGREEARYRRGTSTSTDRETFARIPVFDAPGASAARSGSATFSIPADTMHSFTAPNNRIVWSVKLQGEIPNWPDVSEQYELDVRPSRGAGGSS